MMEKIKEKFFTFWSGLISRLPFTAVFGSIFVVAIFLMLSVYQGCVKMLNSVAPNVSGQKQHSRQVPEDLCQKCSRVCGRIHVKTVQSNMTPRFQTAECYHAQGNP